MVEQEHAWAGGDAAGKVGALCLPGAEAGPGGVDQGGVEVEACKEGCKLPKGAVSVDVQALERGEKAARGVW